MARTIDSGVEEAGDVMRGLSDAGIDMDDVGLSLEQRGIAGFQHSFQKVIDVLDAKRQRLGCSVRWTGPDGHYSGCWPPASSLR